MQLAIAVVVEATSESGSAVGSVMLPDSRLLGAEAKTFDGAAAEIVAVPGVAEGLDRASMGLRRNDSDDEMVPGLRRLDVSGAAVVLVAVVVDVVVDN